MTVVLDVRNLKVYYATPSGNVRAVDDVSFQVYEGEILGLVGESGCGKTTTAMAILRMVQPPGRIVGGEIVLDGVDLTKVSDDELRRLRWSTLALIPQGAMNSLNPVMRISNQTGGSHRHARRAAGQGQAQAAHPRPVQAGGAAQPHLRHVPARAERRHEAARLYRHGRCPASVADHRRRADQRARRGGAACGRPDAARHQGARWACR